MFFIFVSSAAAVNIVSDEGIRMLFMRTCELGRILWVTFLVRARKVTRPPVRLPALHLQSKTLTPCNAESLDDSSLRC